MSKFINISLLICFIISIILISIAIITIKQYKNIEGTFYSGNCYEQNPNSFDCRISVKYMIDGIEKMGHLVFNSQKKYVADDKIQIVYNTKDPENLLLTVPKTKIFVLMLVGIIMLLSSLFGVFYFKIKKN